MALVKVKLEVKDAFIVFALKLSGSLNISADSKQIIAASKGSLTEDELSAVDSWFKYMDKDSWKYLLYMIMRKDNNGNRIDVPPFQIKDRVVDYAKMRNKLNSTLNQINTISMYPVLKKYIELLILCKDAVIKRRLGSFEDEFENFLLGELNTWKNGHCELSDIPQISDCCTEICLTAKLTVLDVFVPKKVVKTVTVEEEDYSGMREFLSNNN